MTVLIGGDKLHVSTDLPGGEGNKIYNHWTTPHLLLTFTSCADDK